MTRLKDWLVAGAVLLLGKTRPPRPESNRVVRPGDPSPGAELWAVVLFGLSSLCAIAFVAIYALDRLPRHTQLFGLSLGLSLVFLAAALIVISKRLVVDEELVEEYPEVEHEDEQEKLEQIVEESGSRFTRKRLVTLAGTGAVGALGLAAITPVVSFGPVFRTGPFYETPWTRGRRLVDDDGRPVEAEAIEEGSFYTAYPEGGDREQIPAPLVLVRLQPRALRLPAERRGWAPSGILAFSKICTHAGCAINLYRTPTYPPTQPAPALVCPCHYSTFDVATGGTVVFGPAGRPLPQLPLLVDPRGHLRAAGNFSSPPGPSWWGTRMGHAHD
jgi:ubiquinol-cytochrome c reductase iron-sulfur subunit